MSLESKFNGSTDFIGVISLGGVLVSGLLLFTPVQGVGYIGVGSGLGAFTASVVTRKKHLQITQQHINGITNQHRVELSAKEEEILVQTAAVNNLKAIVNSLRSDFKKLESGKEAQALELSNVQLHAEALASQNQQLRQHIERVTGELDGLIDLTRTAVEEALGEWEIKLTLLTTTKREQYPKLADRLDELFGEAKNLLSEYGVKLAETPRKWDSLADLLSLYYCVNDDLSNIKTKAIQAIAKLSNQETQLELQEVSEILEEWQEADLVPRDKVQGLVSKYEAMLSEFRLDLNNRFEVVVGAARKYEEGINQDEQFFLKMKAEILRLEQTVATLELKLKEAHQIRLFDDIGWKSDVANKVLHHFQLNEIVCDACPLPVREVGSDLEFYLTPRTRLGMNLIKADVEKVAESLRLPLGAKYVKVSLEGKNIKVRLPFEDREVKKISPEDVLGRPVNVWGNYLGSEYHLVIFAATQSGKTSLADELNALQYSQLGGQIEFNAITLKNDGNRDEGKVRRFVSPRFMPSNREYMQALGAIHNAIEERNQILQVNPNHRFPRQTFQLDEYGEYYRLGNEEEKKTGKDAVITLLQRGAGLSSETGKGVSLTLIAQNPYVSLLGLNKPDFANTCIIIVGEKNIRLFLESDPANHGLDEDDLERLRGELKLFKEASRVASEKAAKQAKTNDEDIGVAIRKCPENYYSLVVPSKGGLPPVIIYNPKPGEFTNGFMQESKAAEKPSCPDCKTVSDRRKGSSSRYYCGNQACQRQTFTWKGLS
jgi:hypothetical protein